MVVKGCKVARLMADESLERVRVKVAVLEVERITDATI